MKLSEDAKTQASEDEEARKRKWEEDYQTQREFEKTAGLFRGGEWIGVSKIRRTGPSPLFGMLHKAEKNVQTMGKVETKRNR